MDAALLSDGFSRHLHVDASRYIAGVIIGYRYEMAPFAPADVTAIPVPPASDIPFLDEPELTHDRITRAYSINSSDGLYTLVVDKQGRSALLWSL